MVGEVCHDGQLPSLSRAWLVANLSDVLEESNQLPLCVCVCARVCVYQVCVGVLCTYGGCGVWAWHVVCV